VGTTGVGRLQRARETWGHAYDWVSENSRSMHNSVNTPCLSHLVQLIPMPATYRSAWPAGAESATFRLRINVLIWANQAAQNKLRLRSNSLQTC
jgi:hypothetical protein